jgi:starch synthase (maltosyl-transferring)
MMDRRPLDRGNRCFLFSRFIRDGMILGQIFKSMILYNLFPLLAGKFRDWDEHLKRARALGFDWVYLNPIQLTGASGSLYSISDYFQINPAFVDGTSVRSPDEQCRAAIARGREAGLKFMIDLVINHTAVDSPLTKQRPEWFEQDEHGHIRNARCQHGHEIVIWKDLAKLDYRHTRDPEGLFHYVLRVAEHLISLGCEGFRCDAAYQIPRHFWHRLIHEVRKRHPHVKFAAETLGCTIDETRETARAGFDFVFNSSKWWDFDGWWLIEQYNLIRETAPSISFPESHDTPRLFAETGGNLAALKQRYLFAALFSSGVMMPMGYEFGLRKPLHVVSTTPADWQPDSVDLRGFITQVNALKQSYAVFQEESPTNILHCKNPNVLLMWKASTRQRDEALLILNKDSSNRQDFHVENFRQFVQSGAPLRDVSPEQPLEFLPEPFHYTLQPGQGIVLVTERK